MNEPQMTTPQWVFGYGSLIWRVDFDYQKAKPAYIKGWQRRFWQGSTDHRGTPETPGRVVTLVEAADQICWGMAYCLNPETATEVLAHLDHREKGGYERITTPLHFQLDGKETDIIAITYHAVDGNENYLGPATDASIAGQIIASAGPSGPNIDYLLNLESALADMQVTDTHIIALANHVRLLAESVNNT